MVATKHCVGPHCASTIRSAWATDGRQAKVRDTRLLKTDRSHLGVATILVPLTTIDFE
jgi:hypothetical protein